MELYALAPAGDAGRVAYVRTMLGALEMLRRGITAVHDDAYHVPVARRESIDAIMRVRRALMSGSQRSNARKAPISSRTSVLRP